MPIFLVPFKMCLVQLYNAAHVVLVIQLWSTCAPPKKKWSRRIKRTKTRKKNRKTKPVLITSKKYKNIIVEKAV